MEETSMRLIALAVLAAGMALTATSARAQTYDPGYPVCSATPVILSAILRRWSNAA
jgi:hypothetical protein